MDEGLPCSGRKRKHWDLIDEDGDDAAARQKQNNQTVKQPSNPIPTSTYFVGPAKTEKTIPDDDKYEEVEI